MTKRSKKLLRISVKGIKNGGRTIDVYPDSFEEEEWLDENMFVIFFSIRRIWSFNN